MYNIRELAIESFKSWNTSSQTPLAFKVSFNKFTSINDLAPLPCSIQYPFFFSVFGVLIIMGHGLGLFRSCLFGVL